MTAKEIQEQRSQLKFAWEIHDQEIRIHFEFRSYEKTMEFVNAVAKIATEHQHHPLMQIDYCKLNLVLTTHDTGSLSQKDFKLAKAIEEIDL